MKRNQKSAIIRSVIVATGLLGLAACDSSKNIGWPHVYGSNEVPPEVLNAPRTVDGQPLPADTSYPRLGDVPGKPKNFPPQSEIDLTKEEMEKDRAEGQMLKQKVPPEEQE